MKRTTWMVLAPLMGFVLLVVPPAVAQQIPPATGQPATGFPGSIFTEGETEGPFIADLIPAEAYPQGEPMGPEDSGVTHAGCPICGGGDRTPAKWSTMQGVRVLSLISMRRKGISDEFSTAFVDEFHPDGMVQRLTTRSVMPDVAAGLQVALVRHLGLDAENRDHFLEFSYWGMNNWSSSRSFTGSPLVYQDGGVASFQAGNLFSPFPTSVGGFNRADTHAISYNAEAHNWELNLRLRPRDNPRLVMENGRWQRRCKPGDVNSLLFGFRVYSLDSRFEFRSDGQVIDANTLAQTSTWGQYNTTASNDLLGIQVGWERIVRRCKWTWGLGVKACPLINFADYSIAAVNSNSPDDIFATTSVNFQRGAKEQEVAFLGEFGMFASYKLRPNFAVRASFDLIWITGLARAPEQLNFNLSPPTELNVNGHTFTQGLSIGAEWLF